jgi:hypothetical protein
MTASPAAEETIAEMSVVDGEPAAFAAEAEVTGPGADLPGAGASSAAETTPIEAIVDVAPGEAAAVLAEFAAAADEEIARRNAAEPTADEPESALASRADIAVVDEPASDEPAPVRWDDVAAGAGVELAEVVAADVAMIGEAPAAAPVVAPASDQVVEAAEISPADDSSSKVADLEGAAPPEITVGAPAAVAASQEMIDEEAEAADTAASGAAAPAVGEAPTPPDPIAAGENGGSAEHVAAAAPLTATVVIPARHVDADMLAPPPEQTAGIAAHSA